MAKPIGQTARIHVFSGICCGLDLAGGEGGLMLVTEGYFEWAMKAMRIAAKELTAEDIENKRDKVISDLLKKEDLGLI